ncbi:GNAT family N-acetyltransferase [Listeria aquatica]|uniref:GNAT family N-acetyltransferase n=1 Tax=Listeria aquatica TaxID=1494960 RepID=UPI003EF58900
MDIREIDLTINQERLIEMLDAHMASLKEELFPYQKEHFSFASYEGGEYTGGITGEILWNTAHISLLAVDPAKKGRGIGKILLKQAEDYAKQNRCTQIHLETMSYQAPLFYEKNGFKIFGELKDFMQPGVTRFYLAKRLG